MKNLLNGEINLLRQNARSMVRELGLLNDAYFDIGVTLAERHLLIELSSGTCPTMGEIAEKFLLDKSTVSRLISKAVKKGYVTCAAGEKDKRKRFLHLTELGRKTLNTFEPIAFQQTKGALLTLKEEEIALVYQGVALYAKGLKNSRLQNKHVVEEKKGTPKGQKLVEIEELLAQRGFTLRPFVLEDEKSFYQIFRQVVDSGCQFPYESSSFQEFHSQFFGPQSEVYVCLSSQGEVVGGFYLKANYSGRSNHIANAAYMIKDTHRGQGIGTLLVNASLEIAKDRGFLAMQFNMVLSQNVVALKLYQKLGFQIIGALPKAIRNTDGTYQEGYILSKQLKDFI